MLDSAHTNCVPAIRTGQLCQVMSNFSAKMDIPMRWSAPRVLWLLTIILFPITTPPFLPLGNVVAKPLSFIFMFPLLFILIASGNYRLKKALSYELVLLLIFSFVAVLTGILHWQFFDLVNTAQGMANYLRALPTLIIGGGFYLTFRAMNLDEAELNSCELTIQWAMMVSIGIEILQAVADTIFPFLLNLVVLIDTVLVDVSFTWTERYHGLAYEPSWLGEQLVLICIPLSLSRVVSGRSLGIFRLPILRIPLRKELFFLFMSVIGIFLSGSRSALFGLLLILFDTGLLYLVKNRRRLLNLRNVVMGVLLAGVGLAGFLYVISNAYTLSIFIAIISASSFDELARMGNFGTRASVWFTSFQVFLANPILGVGLGGSEIYYADYVPDWILDEPLAQTWLAGEGRANPKNLITRLLSETGLVGFLIFLAFVLLHFRGRGDLRHQYLKIAMATGIIVFSFQSDTFALPTLWFALGFLYLSGKYSIQRLAIPVRNVHQA